MEELAVSERRQFKRISLKEPVQFQEKDGLTSSGCLSGDISEGGLRVTLFKFIPIQSDIFLKIHLNSQRVIECLGRVVWIEKLPYPEAYQVGLEFAKADVYFDAQREIRQLLQTNN